MKGKLKIILAAGIATAVIFTIFSLFTKEKVNLPYEFVVYKTPNCGCCGNYVDYLKSYGLKVITIETSEYEVNRIKNSFKIPIDLYSCHTVLINDLSGKTLYFVEGHVPIEAINKLLEEKPNIDGIALPGMPSGSPGMPGLKLYSFKIYAVKDGENKGMFLEI
ncbi:MAG: DUF411 domain-containing protein [Candidatus Aenigmatarchaeota archaeon]